jgi:methionine synthase I (cobalamin-dependent)
MQLDVAALRHRLTVADGGWSLQLGLHGLPAGALAESANLTHPHVVVQLAREYVAAGARIITTNTFAANRFTLARRGLLDGLREINIAGARLAAEAVGAHAVIAGALGPSGKLLAVKEVTPDELAAAVREQAEALAAGGADVILLETYSDLAELTLALRAAKEATGLPVICSMSFDSGPQRACTMMGAQAADCAAALQDAGADVIGCNCGAGVEYVLPAVVALRAHMQQPLWVKPNAGMPELEDGRPVYRQTPDEFAQHLVALIDAGANIIGGCCGTGPGHIQRIAQLAAWRARD